jgi:hypothetical protein
VQRNESDLWEQIVICQYQLPEQHAIEEPPSTDDTDGADGSGVIVEAVTKHIADWDQDVPAGYSFDHDGSLIMRNESEVYESDCTRCSSRSFKHRQGGRGTSFWEGQAHTYCEHCITIFGHTNSRRLSFHFSMHFLVFHRMSQNSFAASNLV